MSGRNDPPDEPAGDPRTPGTADAPGTGMPAAAGAAGSTILSISSALREEGDAPTVARRLAELLLRLPAARCACVWVNGGSAEAPRLELLACEAAPGAAAAALELELRARAIPVPYLVSSFPDPWEGPLAVYPLVVEGRVTGVLGFAAERPLPDSDTDALGAVADLLAHYLVRKRLAAIVARAQADLCDSRKLAAIGRLAGGIVHDFNNMLAVILGYSELLLSRIDPQADSHAALVEVHRAAERAATLTRQLLTFTRERTDGLEVLDLNQVTAGSYVMLSRLVGEQIRIELTAGHEPACVRTEPGHIEQILMNLVLNAREALPTGGSITIETSEALVGGDQPGLVSMEPGRYAVLTVSDTGLGMPPAVVERAIEPFFTTKAPGQGTGIGLSTVDAIVAEAGGALVIRSAPGRGTTVRVYLPRVENGAGSPTGAEDEAAMFAGTETVLLVEDEPIVCRFAEDVLRASGYRVLTAWSGAQALTVAREHEDPIDLLISDVVLPDLGGGKLGDLLSERFPGLAVLYVSGYTSDIVVQHGVVDAGAAFVQKPFTPRELARKVREVLDAAK